MRADCDKEKENARRNKDVHVPVSNAEARWVAAQAQVPAAREAAPEVLLARRPLALRPPRLQWALARDGKPL